MLLLHLQRLRLRLYLQQPVLISIDIDIDIDIDSGIAIAIDNDTNGSDIDSNDSIGNKAMMGKRGERRRSTKSTSFCPSVPTIHLKFYSFDTVLRVL